MPSSGAGGPCGHCLATTTCCWRRGPPGKETLCNACGSRYMVKKSLDGYLPVQQRQQQQQQPGGALAARGGVQKREPRRGAARADGFASDDSAAAGRSGASSADAYAPPPAAGAADAPRPPSLLGGGVRVANAGRLRALGPGAVQRLLAPTLRRHSRKPLRPAISVVF